MQTLDLLSNLQHRISQHKHSCSSVVTTMLASSIWERFLTTDKWPRPRIGCHPQHQALTTQTDKTEEAAQRLKLLLPCPFLLALPLLYRTRCREQWLDTCDPHAVINYKRERWMVKNSLLRDPNTLYLEIGLRSDSWVLTVMGRRNTDRPHLLFINTNPLRPK